MQPRPVDCRPIQAQVANAASACPPEQLKDIQRGIETAAAFLAGAAIFKAFQTAFDQVGRAPQAPAAGCLPPPSAECACRCAPTGQGLTTNPQGWPQGSVRTAGGYTIVPEGKDQAWKIYGPQQCAEDKPLSRVWGDPHVDEADGQRWDFTKSSTFRLPDGTTIDVGTTSETGRSLSSSLTITNGNDRVGITGIDQNKPVLGQVSHDGFDYRAQLETTNPNRDTFVLGGTGREADGNDRVQWARARHGQVEGVITGSVANADGKNSYDQTIDRNKPFSIDTSLRPDPIRQPQLWGSVLESELSAFFSGRTVPNERDDAHAEERTNPVDGFRRDLMRAQNLFRSLLDQLNLSASFGATLGQNRGLFV